MADRGKTTGDSFAWIFLFLGFVATITQAIVIREALVVFYGNELIMGAIFGSWFVWIALGARLGSACVKARGWDERIFTAAAVLGLLAVPLQVASLRLMRLFLAVPPGEYVPFVAAMATIALALAPFSFMVGFTFPLGASALARTSGQTAGPIGRIYVIESIGSMFGGLIFTYIILARLNVFLASALNLAAVSGFLLIAARIQDWRAAAKYTALSGLVAGLVLASFSGRTERVTVVKRWSSFSSEGELVVSKDTRYQNLALARTADQYGLYGNGLYFFPFPDPYGYARKANYILCQHPHPDSVLVVGNSSAGLLDALLDGPVKLVDTVELDPGIDEAIRPYLPPKDRQALDDPRARLFHTDGRFFIRTRSGRYDLVFINLPDPSSAVINRYYTLEFFREVKRVLKPGGVLSLSLTASENYLTEDIANYCASVYNTLKRVFPEVLVSSGDTYYFFAGSSPGTVTADTDILAKRYRERGVKSDYFSPYLFRMIYPPERLRFIKRALERRKDIQINSDLNPVTYFFNLLLWDTFAGGARNSELSVRPVLRRLARLPPGWLWAIFLLLVTGRLLYVAAGKVSPARQGRFNALAAVATCGFTAMGTEIILIYGFQNLFGSLYYMIALVTASFMLGLALGSWALTARLDKIRRPVGLFIVIQSGTTVLALAIPAVLEFFAAGWPSQIMPVQAQVLFILLLVIPGFLTGAGFPLGGSIVIRTGGETGPAAGLIDSADHLGAFVGAFLTGTLIVPVFGVRTAVLLIALSNLAVMVLWLRLIYGSRGKTHGEQWL